MRQLQQLQLLPPAAAGGGGGCTLIPFAADEAVDLLTKGLGGEGGGLTEGSLEMVSACWPQIRITWIRKKHLVPIPVLLILMILHSFTLDAAKGCRKKSKRHSLSRC